MADAATYIHADDVEQTWIDSVTERVRTEDLIRRRWLVENLAGALGAKAIWPD